MIYLPDLSHLMQRVIAKGITFMVSQSGVPNYYNLYFAKHMGMRLGNRSIYLTFNENKNIIYQCADENHPMIEFNSVDEILDYVDIS